MILLLQKNERSWFSLNELPIRILSGRSLSDRDSLTLVSDSLSLLGANRLSYYVSNFFVLLSTYMISTTVPCR